jgi:hypothetical protein
LVVAILAIPVGVAASAPSSYLRSITVLVESGPVPTTPCSEQGFNVAPWNVSIPRGTVVVFNWTSVDAVPLDWADFTGNVMKHGSGYSVDGTDRSGIAEWGSFQAGGGIYSFSAYWAAPSCGMQTPVFLSVVLFDSGAS